MASRSAHAGAVVRDDDRMGRFKCADNLPTLLGGNPELRAASRRHPGRRQGGPMAEAGCPQVKIGHRVHRDLAGGRRNNAESGSKEAVLESDALREGRSLLAGSGPGLLLLSFGDRLAHAAGVLAVEGLLRAFDEAVLCGVVDDHARPSDHLHHAPVTAAEMQAAQDSNGDAHETVQDDGGMR